MIVPAIGCPRYKSPPNTWFEEGEGYITVGCRSTDDHWKMRCIGSHWLGPLKDCSKCNAMICVGYWQVLPLATSCKYCN